MSEWVTNMFNWLTQVNYKHWISQKVIIGWTPGNIRIHKRWLSEIPTNTGVGESHIVVSITQDWRGCC